MKRYKALIFLVFVMLLATQWASGQVIDLKLGAQRSDMNARSLLVGAESRIGERLTFQPQFGFGTNLRNLVGYSSINAYHFGLDGRVYLFLRQQQYFCGLYAGVFVSHDRIHWNIEGYAKNQYRRYSTSGGLLIGYQQAFLEHFRVDGGVKLGYRTGIWEERYNAAGGLVNKELHGFNFAGYLYLQLGYAF